MSLQHQVNHHSSTSTPTNQHPPEYFLRRQLMLLNNLTNFPASVTECGSSFIDLQKFPLFCKTWEALCKVRNVPASPCKCYGIFQVPPCGREVVTVQFNFFSVYGFNLKVIRNLKLLNCKNILTCEFSYTFPVGDTEIYVRH